MNNKIRSLKELKEYCKQDDNKCISESEVYISLNGMLRSSKYIQYYEDGSWWINHQIDDTEQEYKNDKEFKVGYPLLFEAMKKGCLIKY